MTKKAQGLPLETIIIATILIVLLIFVIFFLAKHGGTFTKGTTDCVSNGGQCIVSAAECISQGGQPLEFQCPKATPACCRIS